MEVVNYWNQKFTKIYSKKLKQAFQAIHADREIHLLKKEGTVTVGWERLAQVRPKADKTCALWWVNEAVNKYEINKERIQETFDNLCRSVSASSVTWSL